MARSVDEVMDGAEVSPEALVMTLATPPYVIVYANPAWEVLCGWTLAEVYGKTCKLLQGPETDHAALYELHMAMLMRQILTIRLVNYKKDGTRFINDLTVEPLAAGTHAAVTHMLGTLRDRTLMLQSQSQSPIAPAALPFLPSSPEEFEQIRRQLKTRPRTLEDAIRPSNEARVITETSRPYQILHVNGAWSKLCGYSSEEAVGKTCRILQGPGTCVNTLRAVTAACEKQESVACKLLNYTRNGHTFINMLIVSPLTGADGRVTHLLGTLHPESILGILESTGPSGVHTQSAPSTSASASTSASTSATASTSAFSSTSACPDASASASTSPPGDAASTASAADDFASTAGDVLVQQPRQLQRREPPRQLLPPPPLHPQLQPPPLQQPHFHTGCGGACSASPAQQPAVAVTILPSMNAHSPPQACPGGALLPSPELRAAQLWAVELLLKQDRLSGNSAAGAARSGAAAAQQTAEPSRAQLYASMSLQKLQVLSHSVESLSDRFRQSRVALDSALDQLVQYMMSDPRFARMIAEAREAGTLRL